MKRIKGEGKEEEAGSEERGRDGEEKETLLLGGHRALPCTSNHLRESTFLVFSQPEQKKLR